MERKRNWKRGLWLAALVLLAALALGWNASSAPAAHAQQPTGDLNSAALRIEKQLYCPVCVGVPLDVCDTQACEQWRALIMDKLKAGESEEQIRQYFISQYGDRVLGAPPPQGFNIGAYVLPLLILLAGAGLLLFTMRGWLRARAAAAVPAPVAPIAKEYADRIARELRERE